MQLFSKAVSSSVTARGIRVRISGKVTGRFGSVVTGDFGLS